MNNFDDKYVKLEKVAEGSYGIVYKAKSKANNKPCSVKIFKNISKEGIPVSGIRQITILKNIDSPYILPPIDVYQNQDSIEMVTDWGNQPLSKIISSPASFNHKQIMKQILRAVDSLHKAFVIHRDLKPSNIVLGNGSPLNLKIIDFGDAKQDTWQQNPSWTNKVGTSYYRSPELLAGFTSYNNEVDLWAIGCIFYELLTRKIMFLGVSEISQMKIILEQTCSEEQFQDVKNYLKLNIQESGLSFSNWEKVKEKLSKYDDCEKLLDLLKKLLSFNGKKRITCQEAFQHPYFS